MLDDETGDALVQRADDTEEALRSRLESYHSMTVPLLDHYSNIVVRMDSNENKAAELIKEDVMSLISTEPLLKVGM
jgi:adenylate kinase